MSAGDDKVEQKNGCALYLLAWLLGWISGAIAAVAFSKGWEWFVADTFDIRGVSFVQAWGLNFVAHFATYTIAPAEKKRATTTEDVVALWLTSIILSLTVLGSLLILVQFR